jgi:hypothetical protein
MLLVTAVLIVVPALARAAVRPSSKQLFRKGYGGNIINAPLTDHTRNDGKTDLQWYAKVSVGTPPQELYVSLARPLPADEAHLRTCRLG